MTRATVIVNWVVLGLVAISIAMGIRQNITPLSLFVPLLPLGTALMALRGPPKRWFSIMALAINGCWLLAGAVLMVMAFIEGVESPLLAALAVLLIVIPAGFNVSALIETVRGQRVRG